MELSLKDRIMRCIGRHPDWTNKRIANSASCRVREVVSFKEGKLLDAGPNGNTHQPGIISLEQVFKKYDIRSSILRELAAVPRGELIQEEDLRQKSAGQDRNRFRRTIENNAEEFKPVRLLLKIEEGSDGKWYWGHAEDIKKAKEIRDK